MEQVQASGKPKPPPKPKLPPKPPGLLLSRSNKPGRIRLHLNRMFSSGNSSQPPSPTVSPTTKFFFATPHSSSCENLSAVSSCKRFGSTSSGGGSSGGECSPDLSKKRQHWRARSDTDRVRQLLRQKRPVGPSLSETRQQQDTKSLTSTLEQCATQELFDLVVRAQRSRIDDQRCELPPPTPSALPSTHQNDVEAAVTSTSRAMLEKILRSPGPYPMLILPTDGGYWSEGGEVLDDVFLSTWQPVPAPELETDEAAGCYRKHFMGREHYTLIAEDPSLGPVVLSMRTVEGGAVRILLRLRTGTKHCLLTNPPANDMTPAQLAKQVDEEAAGLQNEKFTPIVCPRAAELIAGYDEHALVSTFKFGVVPQRCGQTKEEQLFSIRDPSPALLAFLELLGSRVQLREHKGYRGGLDTQFGQTGEEAVFRVYRGRELMFHVAPLLPFAESDPQQLQRKRHIGNDIVTIIFQEDNTPFAPDMIASHFLHVFIVVQPLDIGTPRLRYRVSVTARKGVPKFGPELPDPAIFKPGPEFQEWLLTKLINAEAAACKASTFASLQGRTRTALLSSLVDDLRTSTRRFLGEELVTVNSAPSTPPATSHTSGSRFIDTVRKALTARNKNQKSIEQPITPTKSSAPVMALEIHGITLSDDIADGPRPSICRSLLTGESSPSEEGDASSLSSAGDTGLESLASLRTRGRRCSCSDEVPRLRGELAELQRQNNMLKEKSIQLEFDLAIASSELRKLREVSTS